MKERPILFNGEMVRAILEGSKTQTRRVMKPQSDKFIWGRPAYHYDLGCYAVDSQDGWKFVNCPYGQPGDRLWCRETWQVHRLDGITGKEFPNILYKADSSTRLFINECVWKYNREKPQWRPPIHMPRWASRITLEINDIRVERLQDISEEDAWAEGCEIDDGRMGWLKYRQLWESINGAESWASSPWVWVIEFKRL